MAGKMQEGISVADLDADSLNESAENTQEDQIQDQIQNDQLEDAQLDDSLSPEHYDASDLRVLEGLEAVRIRPGMYIGSTGPRGLHHLVYEIVDNSVDEALAGYASHIEVTILPDGGVRVVDDGRGIPVDEVPGEGISGVETVMTKLHAGGKFGGGGYAVSGGLHGVGISVVNALSTRVDIEVRRQGFHWTQTYIDQKPTARLLKGKPMEEGESTGTSVTFWADGKIFETTTYDFEILRNRFQQMAFLNKGLKISLTDLREPDQAGDEVSGEESETEDKFQTVTYQYNDGIKDYVDYLVKSRKATPVEPDVIDFEAEDLKIGISAEIAMQWTTAYSEAVHTFANTISTTEGGTHEEGFRAALTSLVNRYAREKNILKDKDENLSGDDVREGVAVMWHEGVDVSITGNSTNPTRFQHPVAGTYKKECNEKGKKYFSVASGGGTGRTLHPDNVAAGPASYGLTDSMGRMHGDAQFAGSSSVPAHVEMMGLIGAGNNPMVGMTVACAVAASQVNA